MKISADVHRYAEEQGMAAAEALKAGMEAKSEEFRTTGGQLYSEQDG